MPHVAIERVHAPTAEVIGLLAELDAALEGPHTEDQRHALSVERLFQPNIRFFLVRLDGVAVACGGVAFYDGYAEVKRMFSRTSVRRLGMATALLQRIEEEARAVGATILRIETGVYQLEALRFYEGAGFSRRGAFGPYAEMPSQAIANNLFYEKSL